VPVRGHPRVSQSIKKGTGESKKLTNACESKSPDPKPLVGDNVPAIHYYGMPYAEIADVLGRKEEAVRQLARRARDHVRERRSRFDADQTEQRRVTERFLEAASNGDLEALMEVLSPGVTLVADGGGHALAPRRLVRGADKVARFLVAVATEEQMARFLESVGVGPAHDLRIHLAQVNGGPGIVATSEGELITAIVQDVTDGVVQTVHLVANPEKLAGVRAVEAPAPDRDLTVTQANNCEQPE
jgi:Sigma-70, region 4